MTSWPDEPTGIPLRHRTGEMQLIYMMLIVWCLKIRLSHELEWTILLKLKKNLKIHETDQVE